MPIPAPLPGTFGAFLGGSPSTGVAGGVHCGVSGPAGACAVTPSAGAAGAGGGATGAGGGASVAPVVSMASVAMVGEGMKNLLMKHAGVRDIATLHDAK